MNYYLCGGRIKTNNLVDGKWYFTLPMLVQNFDSIVVGYIYHTWTIWHTQSGALDPAVPPRSTTPQSHPIYFWMPFYDKHKQVTDCDHVVCRTRARLVWWHYITASHDSGVKNLSKFQFVQKNSKFQLEMSWTKLEYSWTHLNFWRIWTLRCLWPWKLVGNWFEFSGISDTSTPSVGWIKRRRVGCEPANQCREFLR